MGNDKATSAANDDGPQQTPGKIALFAGVAVGMTVLDQITKVWVRNNLLERSDRIVVVDDFFNIVHAENPGAAFGFLNDSPYRMWVFAAFTVIALVVLFRMFLELPDDDRFQNVALGMIVSGAVGNAIDRVLYQSVTDMIDMYVAHDALGPWLRERFGTTHWPTYNVADVAIVAGLLMFGFHYLFLEQDEDDIAAAPPDKALDEDAPPPRPGDATPARSTPQAIHPDAQDAAESPTDEIEPVGDTAAVPDMVDSPTEQLQPPDLDDFAEQRTEAMQPVDTHSGTPNLADLGKD